MPDREKVIGRLQFYVNICREDERSGEDLNGLVLHPKYVEDAIALLKEMEPRVMTPEDCEDNPKADENGFIPAWIEYRRDGKWLELWEKTTDGWSFATRETIGGVGFRWWTCQPTDEQRKAVEWNDQGGGHQNSGPV